MPERAAQQTSATRYYGKYRGLVTKNDDPDKSIGRIQVVVPQVLGDTPVWALPCVAYAGTDVGFFALPKVGTGVWVEFEAGDFRYPIWTGCVWADGDIPVADAKPNVKFLKTDVFTLHIDDDAGEVRIEHKNGSVIVMQTGVPALQVKAGTVNVETGPAVISLQQSKVDITGSPVSVNQVLVVS